jgi:NAD(P)-dependent dehydrogenase (short-subunit alcohol dehydrogenase family)
MAIALITGGSKGLGRALTFTLLERGWSVVIDGRDSESLAEAERSLNGGNRLVVIAGDVADPSHRRALVDAAERLGGLDLLVNNASTLGASPLPWLADITSDILRSTYEVNVVAPVALTQAALPLLRDSERPRVLNVSSDAAVEAYEGWGGYGSSKAALDHLSAVLAAEEPELTVWAVDPGDMRTQMHQDAFPGEDISDRPLPDEVVPLLVALIDSDEPSGRKKAAEFEVVR